MKETMPILTPIRIGKKTAANRIAINAMECCDADTNGNPTQTAFRRYERLARGDAGVIVVEALSVVDENRGRLHQLTALPQNQKASPTSWQPCARQTPSRSSSGSSPTRGAFQPRVLRAGVREAVPRL